MLLRLVNFTDRVIHSSPLQLAVGAIQLYHAKLTSSTDEVKESEANVNNVSRVYDNKICN